MWGAHGWSPRGWRTHLQPSPPCQSVTGSPWPTSSSPWCPRVSTVTIDRCARLPRAYRCPRRCWKPRRRWGTHRSIVTPLVFWPNTKIWHVIMCIAKHSYSIKFWMHSLNKVYFIMLLFHVMCFKNPKYRSWPQGLNFMWSCEVICPLTQITLMGHVTGQKSKSK